MKKTYLYRKILFVGIMPILIFLFLFLVIVNSLLLQNITAQAVNDLEQDLRILSLHLRNPLYFSDISSMQKELAHFQTEVLHQEETSLLLLTDKDNSVVVDLSINKTSYGTVLSDPFLLEARAHKDFYYVLEDNIIRGAHPVELGGLLGFVQTEISIKERIDSTFKDLNIIITVTGLSLIILIALFSVFMANQISKPINELDSYIQSFDLNNLDKSMDASFLKRDDEIGRLSITLNTLKDNLSKRIIEVNRLLDQKSRLFGQLAHDLKTPLVPIIGLLPEMEEQETDPKKKKLLTVMVSNGNRLYSLIKKILTLIRLDSTSFKLHKSLVDPTLLFQNIIKNNEFNFSEKNLIVTTTLKNVPKISFDESYISEVIENLISNAIKFTPSGKKINFSLYEKETEVYFKITDEGHGIKQENLKKLFDEFYKEDWSRHEASSGLGLSICKQIVKAHNGRIWAESSGINCGSSFIFTLPIIGG